MSFFWYSKRIVIQKIEILGIKCQLGICSTPTRVHCTWYDVFLTLSMCKQSQAGFKASLVAECKFLLSS